MPLPFAIPIGLILGMSLAWLARVELARSEVPLVLARPFLVALGFGAIVHAPVVAYFLVRHGDWAWLYLVRHGEIPSAVDLTLVLVAALQLPLGLAVGAPWAIAKRGPPMFKVGAAAGAVLLIAGVLGARRLSVSATYVQYHAGFGALPISRSPLGRGVLLSWVVLLAGYAWSARVLRAPRADS